MKRFIDKGYERMNEALDLMDTIKDHRKHHKIIVTQMNQGHDMNDDTLDIDQDSEEESTIL